MIKNYSKAVKNIRFELKNYILKSNLKSLVVGVSGGIDSALTLALAKPVCNELNIPLIARSITILTNKKDEIIRAENTGKLFANDFKEINLSSSFEILLPFVVEDFENADKNNYNFKIRIGNIKARLRMIYLYELASKYKGMVLSTDNYTELLLGFWTLHGDVGDYGMIQNLWKTEVYEMARFLAENYTDKNYSDALTDCINAVPTDGLGITNSDLEQIGAKSYDEVDNILIKMLQNPNNPDLLKSKVVSRKINSEFKRNNPYNIPRYKITDEKYF